MIKGITPVDAAFEVMGLVQAENLMRFLFLETLIGKAVFAIGFWISLKGALAGGNLKSILIYVLIFFSLWFVVVVPKGRVGRVRCAMEASGLSVGTTEEVLRKNGYFEKDTILLLDVFSTVITGLAKGMVVVMDRIERKATTYLEEPMERSLLVIKTRRALDGGVVDLALRERVVFFCQAHFVPAMRRHEEKSGQVSEVRWPGNKEVMAVYTNEAREEWNGLKEEIFRMLNTKEEVFSKAFERFEGFEDKEAAKEKVLKEFFNQEFLRRPKQYAIKNWGTKKKQIFLQKGFVYSHDEREGFVQWVFENSSRAQGVFLFYGYSFFPIVLCIAILLRSAAIAGAYLLGLVWARGMTVLWALTDHAASMMFDVVGHKGEVLFWDMGHVNEVVAGAMLVLPITTGVMIFAGMMQRKKKRGEPA